MKKLYLVTFLIYSLIGFSQTFKIIHRYENHPEFTYLKKVDDISDTISKNVNKHYLEPQFQYLKDS